MERSARGYLLLTLVYTLLAINGLFQVDYVLFCLPVALLLYPLSRWLSHPSWAALPSLYRQAGLTALSLMAAFSTVGVLSAIALPGSIPPWLAPAWAGVGTGLILTAVSTSLSSSLGPGRSRSLLRASLILPLTGLFWWCAQEEALRRSMAPWFLLLPVGGGCACFLSWLALRRPHHHPDIPPQPGKNRLTKT